MEAAAVPNLRVAHGLTMLAVVAMAVVSTAGALAADRVYRDNPLLTATFRGQDVVTAAVAVPLLVSGLLLDRRGSARGRVLWLAMLFYSLYSYLFYAVGAAFNEFFLLYVGVFGLAGYALVFASARIDIPRLGAVLSCRRWADRLAIVYLLTVAAGLGVLWLAISVSYLFTKVIPAPIVASGHPTGVVFAIDLVFIVPPMLIAAIALIRRQALGRVLAAVMSISGAVYTLSLAVGSFAVVSAGLSAPHELFLWVGLTLFGGAVGVLLMAPTPSISRHGRPAP